MLLRPSKRLRFILLLFHRNTTLSPHLDKRYNFNFVPLQTYICTKDKTIECVCVCRISHWFLENFSFLDYLVNLISGHVSYFRFLLWRCPISAYAVRTRYTYIYFIIEKQCIELEIYIRHVIYLEEYWNRNKFWTFVWNYTVKFLSSIGCFSFKNSFFLYKRMRKRRLSFVVPTLTWCTYIVRIQA